MTTSDEVHLLAVGDVMVRRPEPGSIFVGVRPLLSWANVIMGNLEGPCTDRGVPVPTKVEVGSINQKAPPEGVPALAEAGFTAFSLANNHMMDFGPEGVAQTMELLAANGIDYTGAGMTPEEARRPVVIQRGGTAIGMLAYTSVYPPAGYSARPDRPGVATVKVHTAYQAPNSVPYQPGGPALTVTTPDPEETASMLDDVRGLKARVDLLVLHLHMGVAGLPRTLGYMKELSRAAIDAGADMVVGHHAHILQGFELYRGRLICYNLSHFAFDGKFNFAVHPMGDERPGYEDTVAVKAVIRDQRFQGFSAVPVVLDPETGSLQLAGERRFEAVRRALEELSAEFGTTFTPDGAELMIGGPAPGTPEPLRAPAVLQDAMFVWNPAVGSTIRPLGVR